MTAVDVKPLDLDAVVENLNHYADVRDYRSCRDIGLALVREVLALRGRVAEFDAARTVQDCPNSDQTPRG